MKSHPLFMVTLSLVIIFQYATPSLGQSAPSPAPSGPTNVTKILEKAGQFTTLIRLMGITQVGNQVNGQLNNSNNGLTILAPTDNAFNALQSGTLNSLTDQEKTELIQFHIVPSFLSTSQFQTVSNPLRTQAGDSREFQFPLNVTTSGNSVNITTGVTNATLNNAIYSDNQLAVYAVDKVLLPMALFGPKAPAPAPGPSKKSKKKDAADSPFSDDATTSDAVGLHGLGFVGGFVALVGGFYL